MYSLKPILDLPAQIPLPKVMYELPKIQGDEGPAAGESIAADFSRQVIRLLQNPSPEYNLLEARQMRILKELCELKELVEHLRIAVAIKDTNYKPPNLSVKANVTPVHAEIIVNANPLRPPYFILALQRIWKDTNFKVDIHRHSTATNGETNEFEEKLLNSNRDEAEHSVDIRLIWKDVRDIQLVTKVYDYPLEGEANVLRYLSRVIENYNYQTAKSLEESNNIDAVLDLCLQISCEEPRNVPAITAKFLTYLGKNPWLLNSAEPSIVDIAVWSVIKCVAHSKVPKDLKNWYDLCEKTFLSA